MNSSQKNIKGSLTVRSFWKIQKYSFKLTKTSSWRQRVPREKAADWSGHSRLLVEEPQGMGSTTIFQTATALFQISAVQAHMHLILRRKLKFSLQRGHQVTRSPTRPKFDILLRAKRFPPSHHCCHSIAIWVQGEVSQPL